jgi:oligopeptide transport system substrate-binding protein
LTLELELERPASYFLHVLAYLFPVPRHVVEERGDAWTDVGNIVTNGPFLLESFQPGERIILVRNPSYNGPFSGNLRKVEVKFNLNRMSSEELKIYDSNGVDLAELGVETFHARHRYAEEYTSGPSPRTYYVQFDTSRPPFDDARVRRAFVMAVDKERLADEVIGGILYPATGGFVPPGVPGHSPRIGLPYDPVQARQLLTQAGYPEGRNFPNLELVWYSEFNWIEHLKAEWLENLSVEVTFHKIGWADYAQNKRKWHLSFVGWSADYPDPENFLRVGIGDLLPYWRNDVYDRLLEEAQQSSNLNDRIRLYQEADKILIEEAAIMPITYLRWHRLVKPWLKMPAENIYYLSMKDVIIEPH